MPMSFGSVAKQRVATIIVAVDGSGDTTDIQTGINLLPAGGAVYIKEGTYTITSTITFKDEKTSLIGAGLGAEIKTTSDITMIDTNGKGDFYISDLKLYGGEVGNTSTGIKTNGAVQGKIMNCLISSCDNIGIDVSSSNILISGCHIVSREGRAINARLNYTGLNLSGNLIQSYGGYSVYIDSNPRCMISCNYIYGFSGSNDGVYLTSSDHNAITGNVITGFDGYGVNISNAESDKNVVVGNVLVNNVTGAINDAGTGTVSGYNSI